jgi:hypothetical protein
MTEQEHPQDEEREETVADLDVPEDEAGDVEGGGRVPGVNKISNITLKRGVDQ